MREGDLKSWGEDIAILSHDTIALVETDDATLELCRIVEDSDGGAPSLCTLVRLGFPPLTPERNLRRFRCIQERVSACVDPPSLVIEGRPPRRVPFRSSTEEGLVAFVMETEDSLDFGSWSDPYARHVTIVIHLHALVALATTPSPGVTFIPWENWGPRVTACFDDDRVDRCALMGERLAKHTNFGLFLVDFNSSRIRDRWSGNSSGHSVPTTTVTHRSVVPRGVLSREDVVGKLPYMSTPGPSSSHRFDFVNYEEVLAMIWYNVRGRLFPSSVASKH